MDIKDLPSGVVARKITAIYELDLRCENCGGKMSCEEILTTYPPQYSYTCKKCGGTKVTPMSYPRLVYEYEGDNDESSQRT